MNELAFTEAELKFNLILSGFVSRSFKKKKCPLPQFISVFQHIRAECAMVLHENKAEIRTEGGATKLCLCVRFIYLFFILGSTF